MNNLTSQDLFFIKSKIQQSLKLSSSPPFKSKKLLQINKSICNSSAVSSPKETLKNSKKIVTQKDLNDWMIRKQLQVKQFLNIKRNQEEEFNDKVKSSEEIKFRSKQDWLKLRSITQNDIKFQIKKTQSSEVLPEKQKQKNPCGKDSLDFSRDETLYLTGIQKYYNLREKNFTNKSKNFESFQALKINTLKSKIGNVLLDNPQKYEQGYKQRHHKERPLKQRKQVCQSLITPKFNNFFNAQIKKQTEQHFASDDKPLSMALIKASDLKFRNRPIPRFLFPTNSQPIQQLNSYSYRQMQPQQQTELKTRFIELDNRLEQILKSVRKQTVST